MTGPVYGVSSPAAVTLGGAATVTAMQVIGHAAFGLEIVGFDIGLLGVTATDVPGLVEFCKSTGAGAGVSTGAATIEQESGLTITPGFTAFYDYTTEPTVLTPFRRFSLTPTGGTVLYDIPAGSEPQCGLSPNGLAMRLTFPQAQAAWVTMRVRRI